MIKKTKEQKIKELEGKGRIFAWQNGNGTCSVIGFRNLAAYEVYYEQSDKMSYSMSAAFDSRDDAIQDAVDMLRAVASESEENEEVEVDFLMDYEVE